MEDLGSSSASKITQTRYREYKERWYKSHEREREREVREQRDPMAAMAPMTCLLRGLLGSNCRLWRHSCWLPSTRPWQRNAEIYDLLQRRSQGKIRGRNVQWGFCRRFKLKFFAYWGKRSSHRRSLGLFIHVCIVENLRAFLGRIFTSLSLYTSLFMRLFVADLKRTIL